MSLLLLLLLLDVAFVMPSVVEPALSCVANAFLPPPSAPDGSSRLFAPRSCSSIESHVC